MEELRFFFLLYIEYEFLKNIKNHLIISFFLKILLLNKKISLYSSLYLR